MKTACGCEWHEGQHVFDCGRHKIAAGGFNESPKDLVMVGPVPVLVARLGEDPDGYIRASLGGVGGATYITYRGEPRVIVELLETATAALRKTLQR